ncbi:transcription-repair coupling factor [Gynurincola endophyticus]|uniref:transcription-repair coupling factor n=1 Tax=Gynurincola endophyticus TaxID=2479004 RepID=UPI000F8F4A70|nr:transcription-repair coupling factor [Gynurincola endophyticus]
MNLKTLLEAFEKNPRLFQLVDKLTMSTPQHIQLKNLRGGATAFTIASAFEHPTLSEINHVVVCEDAESAAYLHNSLESITQALNIFYFPASFKNRRNYQLLNSSHVMMRTEALTKFSMSAAGNYGRAGMLITYPEALFEKVVLPATLNGNIIYLKAGDALDVDGLLQQLVDYGFERTDFVYEPGQFALRGGILDIYSFGNEKPYRVELFGNDIDSIRLFDPASQLSERRLLQVTIIPNVSTRYESNVKIPLFEFLPENTVYWFQDWDLTRERLITQYEELNAFLELLKSAEAEASQKKKKAIDPEEDDKLIKETVSIDEFVTVELVEDALRKSTVIEWSDQVYFQAHNTALTNIIFATKPQPPFNRQFELLIKDLQQWQAKKYSIYLFAENAKQLERIHTIFEDQNANIQLTPVPVAIDQGFIDDDLQVVCYTDHQIFQRYHKYKVKQAYNKNKAITLRTLRELQPGDFVTHIDHGVGVYSGLQKLEVNGKLQEAVRIIYKDSDILYVNINSLHKISKYTGKEGAIPKVNKLGSDAWNKLKEKTKTKVKEIAFDLIQLYAQRKAQQGFQFAPDNYLQMELEASFIYEDTPDQSKASADVKKDMEAPSPMDRLVCGDVGFGKTEIAIRAAFKACCDSKQVAVLVPTTILAFQHYKTFKERLKDFPVTIDFINRFKTSKEKKETLTRLSDGKIDIIIGTHAILGKDVKFKNLGLLIVDEEQKFGVAHKEKIKTLRTNVDCLTLTATPIPRTLQFSLMGARDLSIMNTPPPNRQPIQTEVAVFNHDMIRDAIYFETERGGQVFFIHNRIQGLLEMKNLLQGLCPDLSIGYAHGQLEGSELEEIILDFTDKKYDVLICTNIVESGVDIPNVNTIIINNAHHFGLSDLHQLRGRVGRGNKKAFCYLLAPPMSTLPPDSRKRLQTLEQHSDLGSGFQIAMRDLDIRGAGNLLGGEQSGFMAEIGFEMYQKILEEAIRELKRSDFADLFKDEIRAQDDYVHDCTIETDLEILIPDVYVESINERLSLYSRIDNCENETELQEFHHELEDRFGAVPEEVEALFDTVRARKMAIDLGFEKMLLKEETLKCFFINKPDSPYFESSIFHDMLGYIQTRVNNARLKQTGKLFLLIVENMKSMNDVQRFLKGMHASVIEKGEVRVEG